MLDVSSRSAPSQGVDVLAFVRRLDWLLVGAVGALVAYGLWAVAGITRYDVEGNESYYVIRQAIAAALGGFAAAGAWSDSIAWWALLIALVLTWVSGLDYARVAPRLLRGTAA